MVVTASNDQHSHQAEPVADATRATSGLCEKGWTSAQLLNHHERLVSPLIKNKDTGEFREASWSEAIATVADNFQKVQSIYGSDAVGVYGSGGLTNEKSYMLGKFARVALRTGSIDYNGRFCMSSAASALNRSFGIDRGLSFPLSDLYDTEVILLVGSNLSETMPPVMRVFNEQRSRGGKLIVVDPRKTPTAKNATLHLQPRVGTDLAVALGLLNIAIAKNYIDHDYIENRTNDFEFAKDVAQSYFPERVEKITGISATALYEVADLIGSAKSVAILTGRGAEQHANGTATVHAFINLALGLGKVGRPHSGFGTITGQGNGQGGREHGQKVDQLPGYRSLTDLNDRNHIAKIWQIKEADLPYPRAHAFAMLSNLGAKDGVKALMVMGSNPVVSAPNANLIDEALKALDFLVVIDPFLSETAILADVVLPCAQWAEETGTMTNVEGRVMLRRQTKLPPKGTKTDLEIISLLGSALGVGDKFPSDPTIVFEELRVASKGGRADYFGINYDKIEKNGGIYWPCRSLADMGEERLFNDRFYTKDHRAVFVPTPFRNVAEVPDSSFPYVLTTGRVLSQYQSGTQTRRITTTDETLVEPYMEIHPAIAHSLVLEHGDFATLTTRRGSARLRVRLCEDNRLDTIFVPFHWGGDARSNSLTNATLDPSSAMPSFKNCAVAIAKSETFSTGSSQT